MTDIDSSLPQLQINYPTCSHCGKDVTIEDDSARCETCNVYWESIDDGAISKPGTGWDEVTVMICKAKPAEKLVEYEHMGQHVRIGYKRCVLPLGHQTKDHLHPYSYDTEPITEETQARVAARNERLLKRARRESEERRRVLPYDLGR